MTIVKWTLVQKKGFIIWWAVGIAALIIFTLAFYPTIRDQTAQLDQSFNQIPESARALMTDTQDLFSPVGYLSSQLFYLTLPMLLTILTINLGSGLVAKEESSGTIELLLSRPISRTRLLIEKAIAGFIITALVGLVSLAVTILMSELTNLNVGIGYLAMATIYATVLALLFGAIAYFMSSLGRSGRLASIGVAAFIALVGYIIASLAAAVSWLKWPAKLTPNHYYKPGEILYGNYRWWPLVCFLLIVVALGIFSAIVFRRRDLAGS